MSFFGTASIGVYSLANDRLALIPPQVPMAKAERLKRWLKVELVRTTIGGSILTGALARANSYGIILPRLVSEEEVESFKLALKDLNVVIMETKRTAYGNSILANDKGAIVDPGLERKDVKLISDALNVEVVPGTIAGAPYVGSLAVATNKGVLTHPLLKEEEKELLKDVLKVPIEVGTVNGGIPYVGTGLISNRWAAVAGSLTTGPEAVVIGQALDVVEEE